MSSQNKHGGKKEESFGRIDFVRLAPFFTTVSTLAIIGAFVLIFTRGFNYGIDFVGGTEIQVKFGKTVETSQVRQVTQDQGLASAQVQKFGDTDEFLIRFENPAGVSEKEINIQVKATVAKVTEGISTVLKDYGPEIRRIDSVGPQVGSQLKRNSVLAVFYCLLVILIYVGLRFEYEYAPGAVFCLFHDAVFTLGVFVLLKKEVNAQTMAAILTIIGYSLNDTIVIYDRIRENSKLFSDKAISWIVNRSVNDCLGRTILTSGATLLAVASLYFIAGGVIHDFSFAMLIGLFIGAYSTIYVASPLIIWLDRLRKKTA